jgi:phosphatidate phosphatase APP1
MYPLLKPLLDTYYPKGTINLRNFNPTNRSFFKFFGSSEVYKVSKAMNIINRYPEHQFILIGDSGEKDPEVYARIYREFPHNIKMILIRSIEGSNLHKSRFDETFSEVPKEKWKVFSEPSHSLLDE